MPYKTQTQKQIKKLIQQTNDVFENCGGVNTDYADFATIALSDFKEMLGNPDLTDRQLKSLIRRASQRYREDKPVNSWSCFTASYINKKANTNIQTV